VNYLFRRAINITMFLELKFDKFIESKTTKTKTPRKLGVLLPIYDDFAIRQFLGIFHSSSIPNFASSKKNK